MLNNLIKLKLKLNIKLLSMKAFTLKQNFENDVAVHTFTDYARCTRGIFPE
jgi:hypothetical protein